MLKCNCKNYSGKASCVQPRGHTGLHKNFDGAIFESPEDSRFCSLCGYRYPPQTIMLVGEELLCNICADEIQHLVLAST